MTFNYVSLFSGVGGFEQALDKLGGNCVFASEIDKFASKAYATLYGEDHLHGDVTKIDAKDVPDHDLLVGGFPCQSFSVAGKRGGFEDSRGTLFFEMARIAKEKQPKVFLAENVKGLVGHDKGRTLDTIVKTLNDIGYRVDFEVLNSKYFGVPQNRERIFIVAVREDLIPNEPWSDESTKGQLVVPKGKRRLMKYKDLKSFNFNWPKQDEVTTRLRDILEPKVDEKYYLSEEKTAKLLEQLEGRTFKDSDDCNMIGRVEGINGHDYIKRVYSTEGMSPTVPTGAGGNHEPKIAEQQQFSDGSGISHCLDANYTKGTSPGDVGKGRRTHVIEQEVRPVLTPDRLNKRQNGRRFKEDGEEAFTLTSIDRHGVAFGEYPRYRIRKLTPLECFRLQGFPDEAHQALVDVGISDSQRYKMAGNAVTVNVIEAIGERLLPLLTK